jgi:RNA polymerase sigma-70 factor, ECF subfamily
MLSRFQPCPRERGPLARREEGRLAPHRDGVQPLLRLPGDARVLRVHVDAERAAVQVRRAQLHEVEEAVLEAAAAHVLLEREHRIDRLRSATSERARYAGDWLPEPIRTAEPATGEERAQLASDLSMAFLVLLERLSPDERAALLLRDVFDADYAEIGRALEKSEAACRQIVHRARARIRDGRRRREVAPDAKERLLARFLAGLRAGDEQALLAVVADDAVWTSDGGGKVPAAHGVRGAARIVRFQLRLARKVRGRLRHEIVWMNGEPAVATWVGDRLFSTLAVDTDGERLLAFYSVLNPDKLRHAASA